MCDAVGFLGHGTLVLGLRLLFLEHLLFLGGAGLGFTLTQFRLLLGDSPALGKLFDIGHLSVVVCLFGFHLLVNLGNLTIEECANQVGDIADGILCRTQPFLGVFDAPVAGFLVRIVHTLDSCYLSVSLGIGDVDLC